METLKMFMEGLGYKAVISLGFIGLVAVWAFVDACKRLDKKEKEDDNKK